MNWLEAGIYRSYIDLVLFADYQIVTYLPVSVGEFVRNAVVHDRMFIVGSCVSARVFADVE